MQKNNLIMSADDFGISQEANDNILKLIKLKKFDRVAIMIDGISSQTEIAALLASNVKLDIHLSLAKLNPMGANRKLKEGIFGRSLSFLYLYFTGIIGTASVEISWEKQITKFEKLFGKNPDGLSSHQHIHFFPAYFKIAIRLCKKHHIKYLRFGKIFLRKNINLICLILNALRMKNLKIFFQSEIATSELLISLDWVKNIENFSQNIPPKITELVCHPEREEEFLIVEKLF